MHAWKQNVPTTPTGGGGGGGGGGLGSWACIFLISEEDFDESLLLFIMKANLI